MLISHATADFVILVCQGGMAYFLIPTVKRPESWPVRSTCWWTGCLLTLMGVTLIAITLWVSGAITLISACLWLRMAMGTRPLKFEFARQFSPAENFRERSWKPLKFRPVMDDAPIVDVPHLDPARAHEIIKGVKSDPS